MQQNKLNVVLCWHMHQPQYRCNNIYSRPWTWLHAIKDYTEMAAHIEAVPNARAVVNFSPHLMMQIDDYARLIRRLLDSRQATGDHILDALGGLFPQAIAEQETLVRSCLRSHDVNVRQRFETYNHLCHLAEQALETGRLPQRDDMTDLLVWYCLAWMGEFMRCEAPLAGHLMEQARGFNPEDRLALLDLIGTEIAGILPRYRRLAESGKIELSVTPWSHPILPLLIDFNSAREAMPGVELPSGAYAEGEERCNWHLQQASAYFEQHFGFRPAGCWPSEGALSERTLQLIQNHGFKWTASGTSVLRNSLANTGGRYGENPQHRLWSAPYPDQSKKPLACIFRDDELSDLIGFTYSQWRAEDAVNDLIYRLEQTLEQCNDQGDFFPTASIIMDGENAWEYYPENGREFLSMLYERLSIHPQFQLSTYSDLLESVPLQPLPRLTAGSWVYGNFSVWIGHPAKNRAWERLIDARLAVDKAIAGDHAGLLPEEQVLEQLSVCESSDWFWWLGEEGRAQDGPAFDELFRLQLKALYHLIGVEPPTVLDQPVDDTHCRPDDDGTTGAMREAGTL
jgi:alpha-amylase/alpha-mannosidase (GH57 family)